jgi:two-component system, LytTR family, sensor kinase
LKNLFFHSFIPLKRDLTFMVVGILVVALMTNTLLFGYLLQEGKTDIFTGCIFVSLGYTTIYWVVFRVIFIYFTKKYPYDHQNKQRRIYASICVVIAYIIAQFVLEFLEQFILKANGVAQPALILEILTSSIFIALISAIYEIKFLSYQVAQNAIQREQVKREFIASELSGLKEQINPHFLFNSLNTLSSLVETEPQKAQSFIQKLSNVYRYILDKSYENTTLLQHELNYLHAYIHLLKERFGDGLQVTIEINQEVLMKKHIIPLSLQITFENCVKHNVVTNQRPLFIKIYTSDDYVYMVNNLQPIDTLEEKSGVGIPNIKKRYSFFTKRPVKIEINEDQFSIALPLLSDDEVKKLPVSQPFQP